MKVDLNVKIKVIGLSKLRNVSYTRLKAVAKKEDDSNQHDPTLTAIRAKYGKFINEYRLVKENEGFIWRNTYHDSSISGHHKTIRKAIYTALWHADIYLDEEFSYMEFSRFQQLEKQHKNRFGCKHLNLENTRWGKSCPDCGNYLLQD